MVFPVNVSVIILSHPYAVNASVCSSRLLPFLHCDIVLTRAYPYIIFISYYDTYVMTRDKALKLRPDVNRPKSVKL